MTKIPKKTTKKAKAKKVQPKKKPRTKKPTSIVVQSPVEPTAQIVVASELADDAMIESELMGEVLPYYIYQFCENKPACKDLKTCTHRKTTGMSVKGVNETVRRLNRDSKSGYKVRINPNHIKIERDVEENGEKGVSVTVYAENLIDGNSAWGTKFEAYMKTGKNGQYKNTFATEKALSKAERNAKRKLIPETVVMKMIEKLIAENPNNVKALTPATNVETTVAPLPPRASTPEEIMNLVRKGIEQAKKVEVVTQFDENVQNSDKFDDKFKLEVRKLASTKIDQLLEKNGQ